MALGFVLYLFDSSSTSRLPSFPASPPSPLHGHLWWHLGGALRLSRGVRGGPSRFELGLVGVNRLRGRRGGRVASLASLLEVALVAGGLGQHLHPPLLVLLQASPELCALPLPLQLSEWGGGGEEWRSISILAFVRTRNEKRNNQTLRRWADI